ncbi:MAG: hypothetical protein ACK41O_05645 [Runella zeae]
MLKTEFGLLTIERRPPVPVSGIVFLLIFQNKFFTRLLFSAFLKQDTFFLAVFQPFFNKKNDNVLKISGLCAVWVIFPYLKLSKLARTLSLAAIAGIFLWNIGEVCKFLE